MKKISLLFLLKTLLVASAFSQVKLTGLTTMYSGTPTAEVPVIAIGTATTDNVYRSSGIHEEISSNSLILKGDHSENLTVSEVFDTTGVHFFVISDRVLQNGQFEYRLTKNGSTTLLPWTKVFAKSHTTSNLTVMNYLGNYQAERGSFLVMDLRKTGSDSALSSAVVFFRKTQPTLSQIFLGHEMKNFMKKLTNRDLAPDSLERAKWQGDYAADQLDTSTGLPKKLELDPDQNTAIFYLREQISKADLLEYQVLRDGKVFIDWKKNDFDNGFVWLTNLPQGDYQLKMRFAIQRENVTTYPFIVKPRWDQTLTFKLLAGGLIAAFFGFLILLYRLRRQRQKLQRTKAERDKAETELRSLYSQLNPHFIFNALSSIQGLVNRNETDKANHYLSTFSQLLRESLINNEKTMVPLLTELRALETYLQLEQLRFQFQYAIVTDDSIEAASVEMPSLLLQPLVENAIKHGVSSMQQQGSIRIEVRREGNDLLTTVRDNGKGFDVRAQHNGFGLKLTKERIRLLNENVGEESVQLFMQSANEQGTAITVRFKNWL